MDLRKALISLVVLAACGGDPEVPATVGTATGADGAGADASFDASGNGDTASSETTPGDSAANDTSAQDSVPGDANASDASASDANVADAAPAKYPLCSQLLTCFGVACSSASGLECAAPCLAGASAAASAAIKPFLDCADQACAKGLCAGSGDPKCLGNCAWEKCLTPALACGADGKSGSADCSSAFGCLEGCKNQGGNCAFNCYAALSPAAQGQLDNLGACSAAAGNQDAFSACPTQALTCLTGGKTGSDDCWKLLGCTSSCDQGSDAVKAQCIGNCWSKASKDAQSQWISVLQCGDSSTPACATPLLTCVQPSGSKTCLDTLGCWEACSKAAAGDSCGLQCLRDASPAEGKKVVELMQCIAQQCSSCKGEKSCEDKCTQEKCKPAVTGCLAP